MTSIFMKHLDFTAWEILGKAYRRLWAYPEGLCITIYNTQDSLQATARQPFTDILDDDLDEHVSAISLAHPFAGSAIIMGHLEAINTHLPSERVQESVKRVDAIEVLVQ